MAILEAWVREDMDHPDTPPTDPAFAEVRQLKLLMARMEALVARTPGLRLCDGCYGILSGGPPSERWKLGPDELGYVADHCRNCADWWLKLEYWPDDGLHDWLRNILLDLDVIETWEPIGAEARAWLNDLGEDISYISRHRLGKALRV